jgi:replicative DNA helicase
MSFNRWMRKDNIYPIDKLTREPKVLRMPSEKSEEGKLLPNAIDLEMAVLGAMISNPDCIPRVIEILEVDCFYKPEHQEIYKTIVDLFERSQPVDLLLVTEELRRRGALEKAGGAAYLAEVSNSVSTAANVDHHARVVLEKYILRQLIWASNVIAERAFREAEDAFDLLDMAERTIFEISEKRLKQNFIDIRSAVHDTIDRYEKINMQKITVTGVPTGFPRLDALTGGLQNSDLIIIAGRPSMGKTAFALSIARNAAVDYGIPVGIFSLEMSVEQLALRLMCAEARVSIHLVRTGKLPHDEWPKLSTRVGRLINSKIFIDDTPALSVLELRAKSRRLKAEHDVGLIIVDYLQLMQGPKGAESREREISLISRSLKSLAKELNIPVIALSQLKRAVEERGDKRPMLSDLRESGSLEQDADVVMFVHRPEYYGITAYDDGTPTEGTAEIIVGKQRNGPVGEIRLAFLKDYTRFENLEIARGLEEAPPPEDIIPPDSMDKPIF